MFTEVGFYDGILALESQRIEHWIKSYIYEENSCKYTRIKSKTCVIPLCVFFQGEPRVLAHVGP